MELYQNRILYQGEILIFHGEDLLVVAFPDTLYAVYQCNYQGVRIIYTPFRFEPKSFIDKGETGANT